MMKRILILLGLVLVFAVSGNDGGFASPGPGPVRILFIGNSYTYYNNLPELLQGLASTKGRPPVEVTMVAQGGATLRQHWSDGDAFKLIDEARWDYVILQEQSQLGAPLSDGTPVINDPQTFHHYARLFDAEIKRVGAKTVFFLTWARRDFPHQQALLNDAYESIARELDATLIPIGVAWQKLRKKEPKLDLYIPDGSHPSPAGSYLAACMIYGVLTGETPVGLPSSVVGHPVQGGVPVMDTSAVLVKLSRKQATAIQRVARDTLKELEKSDR